MELKWHQRTHYYAQALDLIVYKPGWEMEVIPECAFMTNFVRVAHPVKDIYGKGILNAEWSQPIPEDQVWREEDEEVNLTLFAEFVYGMVEALENHEMDEQFFVNGNQLHPPHRGVSHQRR